MEKNRVKIGDLVNFWSSFEPFRRGYKDRNPGIILSLSRDGGWKGSRASVEVLWSDGSRTVEHAAYIESV